MISRHWRSWLDRCSRYIRIDQSECHRKVGIDSRSISSGILIPPAVWKEVVKQGKKRPGEHQVATSNWIEVHDIRRQDIAKLLKQELDEGEAEAIVLADEVKAEVILLDERDALKTAKNLGLSVLGTVGILIWAKRAGKIVNLREILDDLQGRARFRISQTLYKRVLIEVGEKSTK